MTEDERSQLIVIFDQATAAIRGGHDAQWAWLMAQILQLPMQLLPAVQCALLQDRWQNAKNPKSYIKTVAKREALKMGLVDNPSDQAMSLRIPIDLRDKDGRPLSPDAYVDYLSYDGPVKEGGLWHVRDQDEAVSTDEEGRVIPFVGGRPVPEGLLVPEDEEPDARLVVDWEKVAECANLDKGERKILELRLTGFTREIVLQRFAENEEERRKLQAAWRRLDRHMDRVRAVLSGQKKLAKNVPKR